MFDPKGLLWAMGEGGPAFHYLAPLLDHAGPVVGRLGLVLDGVREGRLGEVTADTVLGAPVPEAGDLPT
jgi:hypothetical protein